MAFFERVKEIGTVRAIGTLRGQIFKQLFEESLLLGIIGGVIGLGLAWGMGYLLNHLNISYIPPEMSTPVPLYFNLLLENIFTPFLLVLLSTGISVLYPAFKAARVDIVDMLRHT